MDKELQVIHTKTHKGLPLATIRNFPGCDADMTPAEMRAMAAALEAAASECEQRPMGKREFVRIERRYPLSAKATGEWESFMNIQGKNVELSRDLGFRLSNQVIPKGTPGLVKWDEGGDEVTVEFDFDVPQSSNMDNSRQAWVSRSMLNVK